VFIAVVGISAGPGFVAGLKEVGLSLFIWGIVATSIPLIIAIYLGYYVFKFHPAILFGVCAGVRTTTAALGMVQEAAKSKVPALGYGMPYAIGNTAIKPDTTLHADDEILLAGPTAVVVAAAPIVGQEIEGEHVMASLPGDVVDVYVTARNLHGRTLTEIVERVGDDARGVFLRALTRLGQEVPITPGTRIYIGDVMTLVGFSSDLGRVIPKVGQPIRSNERTDIAFIATGLAAGLAVGLLSVTVGHIPLTLGGGGGALVAGLVFGWLRSRRPVMGAFPPAAQQALSDLGLGGFVAAIGLANGPAALTAIKVHGLVLLGSGVVVTLTSLIVGTLVARYVLRMNPVIACGALAGAMTVDAAVSGCCDVAESQTPVLGVAVPYAIANVVLTVLGPIIIGLTVV
jgi:putative transport protein